MRRIRFYVPGSSLLHQMHPSTKLVLYMSAFVLVSLASWRVRWGILGALFLTLWLCAIPPWKYKVFLLFAAIAFVASPLLNGIWAEPGDPLIFGAGGFGLHRYGLERGFSFAGLSSAAVMLTVMLLTTTRLWELADSPTMLGLHHRYGFAAANLLRYMPEVGASYLQMMDVQRTRGVCFDGPVWEGFWRHCRLLMTLIVLEFSKARAKSNALEARGFSFERAPTYFILPPIPLNEKRLIKITIAITVVAGLTKLGFFLSQLI